MNREKGVSPVIGVLLMLTLTLIIVAIVNSYAGGLMNTEPKPPAVTLKITFHQNESMEIQHMSGDVLPTSLVKLMIKPSETMGRNSGQQSSEIKKTVITDLTGTYSWAEGTSSFKPGEVSYILAGNLSKLQEGVDNVFKITNPENEGNTFYLELYYKNTMISRNQVLIE
jgi:flagellin-like protein